MQNKNKHSPFLMDTTTVPSDENQTVAGGNCTHPSLIPTAVQKTDRTDTLHKLEGLLVSTQQGLGKEIKDLRRNCSLIVVCLLSKMKNLFLRTQKVTSSALYINYMHLYTTRSFTGTFTSCGSPSSIIVSSM